MNIDSVAESKMLEVDYYYDNLCLDKFNFKWICIGKSYVFM